MGEELKILAYGLSSTGKELNLDNMYVNGRYVNVGSDSKSVINKVSHADFQIYGVCDSEIGVENNRELGTNSSNIVMQMMQRLQTTLTDVGKIEKERIWEAMVDTNRILKRHKNETGHDALGSCFASLFLHGNRGLAVHLGDSRIYVVRGGRMLQITDDHLESSDMYRLGVLSQAQAEVHKKTSNLTAYLGMDDIYDAKDEAFSKYFVFYPGDTFIICSDGVSDALPNEEMERMVRLLKDASVDTLANMMMKAAADHTDADMTIMILRVEDAPGEAPKRGNSTIPRKENYEKPAAEESMQSTRTGGVLLSKIQAIRKTEPEEDVEETREDFVEEVTQAPRRMQNLSSINDNPDDYDEEGSLLDKLLSNPKRLAVLAGGAVIVILLLILIITAFGGSGSDEEISQNTSVTIQNSVSQNSVNVNPNANSSLVLNNSSVVVDDSNVSGSSLESSTNNEDSTASQATGSSEPETIYEWEVAEGEYLSGIVGDYYGTYDLAFVEAVAAYNNISIDTGLEIGMILRLPPESELSIASAE